MIGTEHPRLIDRLPPAHGRLTENAPLAAITWFGVGGPAEVLFRPTDAADLAAFLAGLPEDVSVTVVGVGSNILVRDGGVPGVVIRLGRSFAQITPDGNEIEAGAAALDVNVAVTARKAGIAGLEFLTGVPGTIGGALRMNAGAFGTEIRDVVIDATAIDRDGTIHHASAVELGFGYRHCSAPESWLFVSARLRGTTGDPTAIAGRMAAIRQARESAQPVKVRTGGSTFRNPDGCKAWELIDAAGCRGLRIGGAAVSEKHCNFLINAGGASAADLEALGEEVRRRVRDATGVELDWEIRRLGVPLEPSAAPTGGGNT